MNRECKTDANQYRDFPLSLQPQTILSLTNNNQTEKTENNKRKLSEWTNTFKAVCFLTISFDLNITAAIHIVTKKPTMKLQKRGRH